jgi:hypothetical protein
MSSVIYCRRALCTIQEKYGLFFRGARTSVAVFHFWGLNCRDLVLERKFTAAYSLDHEMELYVPAEYATLLEVGLPLTVALDQTGDGAGTR